ncbi:family 10 glycosylhydrolase [Paludicola sp. MB14-C6]|uniref:glycoside hydrolase family 10 protein n=1 Tax=Paludihabitans sp. MB14-C6 TaxID=3070656 RepID=UPI0027DC0B5E|nr:family 10 glycosylhydrolase [Paludicola sp. MB14-C6]WMJ22119.1 family 10 glycosylhydrolase [Paludicola sp. MB14-C6]
MLKGLYKKALSLTLAILLTMGTGLGRISVQAAANETPAYLKTVVHTVLGKTPTLPNTVTMGEAATTVTWNEITQDMLTSGHRFWVNGTTASGKTVALRVQVDAHKVLDHFENSLIAEGNAVTGMLNWSGGSVSNTPPTFSIENSNVHSGLNSLKLNFDFTTNTSGGTLSTYANTSNLSFAAGEVPNSIGLWIYGTDLNYYSLRLLGKSNGAGVTIKLDNVVTPLKKGWNFYEFIIPESCKANGLTVSTLPGLVSLSSASGAKAPGILYIDDIVAIYGAKTRDTSCLEQTLAISENYCKADAIGDKNEILGLRTAIDAARNVMENVVSTQQDIYDAEDFVVGALTSLLASAEFINNRNIVLEDFEGSSGIEWEYATTNSSIGTVAKVTQAPFVHQGTSALKLVYQFKGTAGTALAAVKGSGYPNPKLTFTGEKTPQKIGMWVYGKGQSVFALRLDIRKADKSGTQNIPFTLTNNVIPEGWNYYTIDLAKAGFTKETGVLLNYVPSVLATNDTTKVDSEIYIDDINLIYEDNVPGSELKKAKLIGTIAKARALLIGAVEGGSGGQYPVGSLSAFRLSIASAMQVLSSNSQEQIDAEAIELSRKVVEFENSLRPKIDRPGLLEKINASNELYNNAVEGEEPGQYIVGSKAELKAAIDSAQAVYDDAAATSEAVEKAKTAITAAVATFNTKKVGPLQFEELDKAIAFANELLATAQAGTNPGQYPQTAIDAFKIAKEKAVNDKAVGKTQASINAVLAELKIAQDKFDKAMVSYHYDKTKLNETVIKADDFLNTILPGKLGGQYPQADYDIFKAAVNHAKGVLADIRATEKAIADEVITLNGAMEKIRQKRIPAAWDKYNIPEEAPLNKREMRGIWLSTVLNIDWPKKESLKIEDDAERIKVQKADLIKILDDLKDLGANTVFFQVRPTSDAFYRSNLAPWSLYLTGTYGKDPGFDPLQFAIDETHKRGMELHAWCNPYRISMPAELYQDENGNPMTSLDQVKQMLLAQGNNIYAKHPEWARVATNRLILDPGIPDAIKYVEDCVMEIVDNYDVDGIHFDDYFYVGDKGGFDQEGADQSTYETYGKAQFDNIDDWRRNNTYVLVKDIHDKITETKPWVKFGVSPAGIWRNKLDDVLGSDTKAGIPNYDHGRSDTRKWVLEELVDYICPQVYWSFNFNLTPYGVVSSWWADLLKENPNVKTELYIGMAAYKLSLPDGSGDPYWDTYKVGAEELERQLKFNMANPNINGSLLYNYGVLYSGNANTDLARKKIAELWKTPALPPSKYWANIPKAYAPIALSAFRTTKGVNLTFLKTDKNTRYFAIYRFSPNEAINIDNPKNLIARYYGSSGCIQKYLDTAGKKGDRYVITALNRVSQESKPSNRTIVIF